MSYHGKLSSHLDPRSHVAMETLGKQDGERNSHHHSHLAHHLNIVLHPGATREDTGSRGSHAEDHAMLAQPQHSWPTPPRPPGVRGNPGPFGLLCFGMTTCMLMFVTTGWSPAGFTPTVMSYALFYGGAGQLIAGILELIRGSTFGGTAFSSYGCFWMGWSLWHYWEATKTTEKVAVVALTGDTLWCGLWGFLTLFFFVVTLRKNNCLQTIFGTLFVTFFLLAGANYSEACKYAAGYIGFFCGCSAIYAAIAELYKDELGWTLPGLAPTKYI